MKSFLVFKASIILLLLCPTFLFAQTREQQNLLTERYDKALLQQMQKEFETREINEKKIALDFAKANNIPVQVELEDGGFAELQRIAPDGSLIFYRTFNVAASRSTRTNHLNIGGSTGFNLDGQNMIAYVWDAGHARVTHQEYDGPGGTDRVTVEDAATEGGTKLHYHAAHVTGTICASGFVANAKGMAPQSRVRGYMWNSDLSEATTAASNGMLISSHSYGYRSDQVPDYYFGAYIGESRDWDNLLFNAPYYLMVVAAGNDGTTNYNSLPLDPANPQYDKLTGHSNSKNNLVVASCNDASIDNSGNLLSVSISSFSSQGPTDDYRIKPDITGNGAGLYSTYDNTNSAYNSISGTSMATPNVSGSLLLLQQHAYNTMGAYLRAATLKGLVLHTADDAGSTGPDAIWGWGLMNAKRAAETISQNGNQSIISELTLTQGQTYSITVNSDGVNNLMASISWTDRPGTATSATNSTIARLVHDLDIRVTKNSTTYLPWRLTGVNTNGLGDNTKDPYERIDVSGASGTYTITVTHKGTLTGGSQNYTLIVTGITNIACTASVPTGLTPAGVGSTSAIISWDAISAASYDLRYRPTGTSTWTTVAVTGNSHTINGLASLTEYEVQVRSKCPNGSTSAYSASITFTTLEPQMNYCTSRGNNVNDEYIGRVQLNTIDNVSGSGGGYSDFTNISTTLNSGDSYSITVTPFWTGTVYAEGYAAWIDYNKDGDFDDAGEQVWTRAATTTSPVSGTFTVPAGAVNGATRMRVSMKYNAIPTACETFTYGEVEDYTIIIASVSDTQAPTAPTNLTASNITQTTVDLSWNASTDNVGVTGYDVFIGASLWGTVTATNTTVTGLTPNTTYSFSVKAKDAAGNISASSNVVSVTTLSAPDTQAPTAPTNLTASNIMQTTVDLSWNASTDNVGVTGYDVFIGALLWGTVTTTNTTVIGLSASTAYSFSIQAKDAAGNISASSNVVSVTTLPVPDTQAPTAPTNLTASNITQTTVDLSWNASTDNVGVTGYDVYIGASLAGSVSGTSATVSGLTANTTYNFSVQAKDAAGNISASSNVVTATTLSVSYCASNGTNTSREHINRVRIGTIDNTSGNNGGYGNFTHLSTNLTKGTNYSVIINPGWSGVARNEAYRVWIDWNGDGDFVDAGEQVFNQKKTTASQVSGSFTVPSTAVAGATRMRVSMKFNASPNPCEIYANGEVEDYSVNIVTSGGQDVAFDIFDELAGITVEEKSESNIETATEKNSAIQFIIYPNPVNGNELNITLSNIEAAEIRIYNNLGQIVIQQKYSDVVDVTELMLGAYIIELINEEHSLKKRFFRN
jgi:trimeric autotransporter adhesin